MLKFNLDKTRCMGCSACYSACPKHCISMVQDEEGFLYPEASDDCIDCGLCENVCPMVNPKIKNDHPKTAIVAVTKDYTIWHRSASGGAFSEIVRHWADTDTLVVGAAWDGLNVHHIGVKGFENIAPLCKSKYISSAIENTFIEIREQLKAGGKAIFCGCPCQVDGLRHFLRKDYDKLLTIDLICHGQGSPMVFKACMEVIGEQLGEEILSYEFRTKRIVHEEDYLSKVVTPKGVHYISKDQYQQLFLKQDALRPACGEHCRYRDPLRPGDLTIADCKGLTKIYPDLVGAKRNYSTIVSNSSKGLAVLKLLNLTMYTRPCSVEDVIKYNPLFASQTWFSKNRNKFFEDFKLNPIETIKRDTTQFYRVSWTPKRIIKTFCPSFLLKIISILK